MNLTVTIPPDSPPLDQCAKGLASFLPRASGKEPEILYEKPFRLKNGAPAWEAKIEWQSGTTTVDTVMLAVKKNGSTIIARLNGEIGEDLRTPLNPLLTLSAMTDKA